ncbi:MAG: Asp-tRNA(Asn)/Glu-tRNA(Gln) amidotransferase subunit GatB [bacterium]
MTIQENIKLQDIQKEYDIVIGLEVHIELSTDKKLFCNCKNEFTLEANKNVCPVCLGLPGSLPVINFQAIEYFIRFASALKCEIQNYSKFDRKNYFYPDMPKNYQISQYDLPLALKGYLFLPKANKYVYLRRIHLEEDTGKSIHIGGDNLKEANWTLLNYNRAGVPLIEIVTEPVINSPDEAVEFLYLLRLTALYTDISDVKMEEGSLRCDANISLKPKNSEKLGTKVEIKNINSFRFLHKALSYEITRQYNLIKQGKEIIQETRGWDEKSQTTYSMRSKEESYDYRYFPEPDLLPLNLSQDTINNLSFRNKTPLDYYLFYLENKLTHEEILFLLDSKELNDIYNQVVITITNNFNLSNLNIYKEVIKFFKTDLAYLLNEKLIDINKLSIENISKIIILLIQKEINTTNLKDHLVNLLKKETNIDNYLENNNLLIKEDLNLVEKIVDKVIENNPQAIKDYKEGKEKAISFLIGQAMKEVKSKAKPETVKNIILNKLSKL